MKTFFSGKGIALLSLVTLLCTLSSYTPSSAYGGEGFEVLLNGKVIMQRFGKDMQTIRTLYLPAASADDQLIIRYHHCGQTGKDRKLVVKNSENKVLVEWQYGNAKTANAGMLCKVKDVISLKPGKDSLLKVYYASSELPNERLLLSIKNEGTEVAVK